MNSEEAPKEEVEEEEISQENIVNDFIKTIDEKQDRLIKAISTNQKYIKELYNSHKLLEEKQERLQENFNILLKEEK